MSAAQGNEAETLPEGVRWEMVIITPEIAQQWLQRNPRNRAVNARWVDTLAKMMREGQFVPTPQPIIFDENGDLIDGQHRLLAVIKAGVPVRQWVVWGVPEGYRLYIDQGKPRGVTGALQVMYGKNYTNTAEISVLRAMIKQGDSTYILTPPKAVQLLNRYHDAIRWVLAHLNGKPGVCRAPVQAAVARAYYHYPEHELAAFCQILMSGEVSSPRDSTVVRLSQWLRERTGLYYTQEWRRRVYYTTERVLVAYHNNEILRHLRPAYTEMFPLPEE